MERRAIEHRHVGIDHQLRQLDKLRLRLPAELGLRLGGVADEQVHFGVPQERRVEHDVLLPVEAGVAKVRLKGGYVIECTGCVKDIDGVITDVLATLVPDTKSGTPGSDLVKVKAAITWVGVANGVNAEVRMYDRLFLDAQPDAGGKDFIESLNPNSLKVVTAIVEPSLAKAQPGQINYASSGPGGRSSSPA